MDGLEAVFELIGFVFEGMGFVFECVVSVFEGIGSFFESSGIMDTLISFFKENPDEIVDAIIDLSDLGGSESQNQENDNQNGNYR
ncbi:hypothetical protein EON78_04330 [bacterium]|nr:MAG: hypothetical protein EON78_04330 [bacterium]